MILLLASLAHAAVTAFLFLQYRRLRSAANPPEGPQTEDPQEPPLPAGPPPASPTHAAQEEPDYEPLYPDEDGPLEPAQLLQLPEDDPKPGHG